MVKFEPAAVTQIAKRTEQSNISFELLIYTDFKKGNAKVGADTNLHFEIEEKIHAALAGYERSGIVPIERQVGLLKVQWNLSAELQLVFLFRVVVRSYQKQISRPKWIQPCTQVGNFVICKPQKETPH